jgi:hypothetical protein
MVGQASHLKEQCSDAILDGDAVATDSFGRAAAVFAEVAPAS